MQLDAFRGLTHSKIAAECRVNATSGAASQAMLYFLKQMLNSDMSRLERGQVVFDLQAIHIDEAAVNELPDQSAHCTPPQQLSETCARFSVPLHVAPLEAVFLDTSQKVPLNGRLKLQNEQQRLQSLLQVMSKYTWFGLFCLVLTDVSSR